MKNGGDTHITIGTGTTTRSVPKCPDCDMILFGTPELTGQNHSEKGGCSQLTIAEPQVEIRGRSGLPHWVPREDLFADLAYILLK